MLASPPRIIHPLVSITLYTTLWAGPSPPMGWMPRDIVCTHCIIYCPCHGTTLSMLFSSDLVSPSLCCNVSSMRTWTWCCSLKDHLPLPIWDTQLLVERINGCGWNLAKVLCLAKRLKIGISQHSLGSVERSPINGCSNDHRLQKVLINTGRLRLPSPPKFHVWDNFLPGESFYYILIKPWIMRFAGQVLIQS